MKHTLTNHEIERYDRHLRLASAVAGESRERLARKFVTQRVLMELNPSPTASPASRIMLMVAANLIARFCPRIDITFSDRHPEFVTETLSFLKQVDMSDHAEFRIVPCQEYSDYAAVLSIGRPQIVKPNQTVIEGYGWLALLNQPEVNSRILTQPHNSPFGPLLAAALGAAEVFKALLQPPEGTVARFGPSTVSCFDYSIHGSDPGPQLPAHMTLPLSLLAGIGAVGNAFLLSLSFVSGLKGDLLAVDKEVIDWTNLNRYLLAFEKDADPNQPMKKAELAVRLFRGRNLRVLPFHEPLESVLSMIHNRTMTRPKIVLSAVDNNEARWLMQRLWPDLILEGATDHTLSQVSRHKYATPHACLGCIHPKPAHSNNEISYVQLAAHVSGIRADAIALSHQHASLTLAEDHISPAATDEQRGLLRRHAGKTICSILSELEKISTIPPAKLPVQPAVSFVSMAAGLLMAGELVKQLAGWPSALKTLFQLDFFYPLENALLQPVHRVPTCDCVLRENENRAYRTACDGL